MVSFFTHNYKGESFYFLWDIESGSLHNVDYAAFLCAKNIFGSLTQDEERDFSGISAETKAEIAEELSALEKRGSLNAPPAVTEFHKKASDIKALCLHVCHTCNLRCDYCFADGGTYHTESKIMTAETGRKAVDFLIKNSGKKRNIEIDFFGGEPLLNMKTVKETVSYAKEQAEKYGKKFYFTLTTNGVLLNKENIDYLNEEMDNVVLSIDGRPEVHNEVRHGGDFNGILENFLNFVKDRKDKKYFVRGTFTAKNLDFSNDVLYLYNKGFKSISVEPVVLPQEHGLAVKEEHIYGIMREYEKLADILKEKNMDFFHFMIDLNNGPCVNKRLTGCGAGTEYMAVSPDGQLYPCHRFVGNADYVLGNLDAGITAQHIRDRFASECVLDKPHCADCVSKYYCGGGCFANNLMEPDNKIWCELQKKRLELSLFLQLKF